MIDVKSLREDSGRKETLLVPLINPNEVEALVAALAVSEGQAVAEGQLLAVLETTKSTLEWTAERAGFVCGLRFVQGQTARSGEIFCLLADSAEEAAAFVQPAAPDRKADSLTSPATEPPSYLRITQPALALARELRVDWSSLPRDVLITEGRLREILTGLRSMERVAVRSSLQPAAAIPFDATAVIIYGGGGHGKSLIDLLRAAPQGWRVVGVVDDGLPAGGDVLGAPLLGGGESLAGLYAQGVRLAVNAVGGIGNLAPRLKVFERLAQAGFACPGVSHPRALVEPSASLAAGVQVFAHAYVGSATSVGFGSIVNTGAIISHDCTIGELSNLSPGAILAGGVQVGERCLVGMGVTVNLGVKIGAGARIGNSAVVKADVPPGGVVRAGAVWPV